MDRRHFLALFGVGAVGSVAGGRLARSGNADAVPDEEDLPGPTFGVQRIVSSVDTDVSLAALTFDDGPDPEFTPRILDLLDRHRVKATFMMMGHNAVEHPDLVREIAAADHEIGAHGWSHVHLAKATLAETRSEIELGIRAVEQEAGVPVYLFRPPHGRLTDAAVRLLALARQDILLWSVNRGRLTWDSPERVASHVVGATRRHRGSARRDRPGDVQAGRRGRCAAASAAHSRARRASGDPRATAGPGTAPGHGLRPARGGAAESMWGGR